MTLFSTPQKSLFIRQAHPIGFGSDDPKAPLDILVSPTGYITETGKDLPVREDVEIIEAQGLYLSPGWVDLHTHIWYGGTDISIRSEEAGVARGVTAMVDAGSAGEANFHGLREYVILPAKERIRAFLNIGSIGLVTCNRVSELSDLRSIDRDRTLACADANRDLILGLKVRSSGVIVGNWGIEPLRIAREMAAELNLPLMVHIGEPPPDLEDIIRLLEPGDIITHCFNGKEGGSILDEESLFRAVERAVGEGVRLDVGHGAASYSIRVAEIAIKRGLKPFSISTDLHNRCHHGPVWDLATTMSKLMDAGLTLEEVIQASSIKPGEVLGIPPTQRLDFGQQAEFTIFDIEDQELTVKDSMGQQTNLSKIIEPRWTIIGAEWFTATRHCPEGNN